MRSGNESNSARNRKRHPRLTIRIKVNHSLHRQVMPNWNTDFLLAIENENAVSLSILGFDGTDLKLAREEELQAASQAPLFTSNYKVRSPHV
jgi:hypothetical protein